MELCFDDFTSYYQNNFQSDFARLKGKPLQGAFDSRNHEYFYVASYLLHATLQKFLDLKKVQQPLPPINLADYGIDFAVALGIAKPLLKKWMKDEIENVIRENLVWQVSFNGIEGWKNILRYHFSESNLNEYIGKKFLKNLREFKDGFAPETFEKKVDELMFVATSLSFEGIQNFGNAGNSDFLLAQYPYYGEDDFSMLMYIVENIIRLYSDNVMELAEEWGGVKKDSIEGEDHFDFYIYQENLDDETFRRIRQRFHEEVELNEDMAGMQLPIGSENSDVIYEGPHPKGYFQGIVDEGGFIRHNSEDFDDREEVYGRCYLTICLPNIVDAGKLFCQVLEREGIKEEVLAVGSDLFQTCLSYIRYYPGECKMKIRHCYDDSESLQKLLKQVDEQNGTHFSDSENLDAFPLDDPDAMKLLGKKEAYGFYALAKIGFLSHIHKNPPSTFEELKEQFAYGIDERAGIKGFADKRFIEYCCKIIYNLAYLLTHYNVTLEPEENIEI